MALLLDILAAGVVDDSGLQLSNGVVYVYQPGTTTKVSVYSDDALTNPVANPITLDVAGKAEVYTESTVRLVIEDENGNPIDDLDRVGVQSVVDAITGDLLPDADDSHDIGSTALRFSQGHFREIYAEQAFIDNLKRVGANTPGWINNLGISLQSGVFSIVDAQGGALSASNPGFISCPSATAGQLTVLKVTSGGSFNDDVHASSDLTNFGAGITETANWAVDMPWFLYVINKANANVDGADGSSVLCITRNPAMITTPSAANNIGDTGAIPVTDDQTSILILDDVTVANYVSLPCQLIGAFRMRWASGTTDWTVQTLGNNDGLGSVQLAKNFATLWTFPQGQNGASASTFFRPNGGTAPTFTTNDYVYVISPNGQVVCYVNLNGDGGTDGAGGVAAQITMPYTSVLTLENFGGALYVEEVTNTIHFAFALVEDVTGGPIFRIIEENGNSGLNSDFANGGRSLAGTVFYKAY